jgi:hypothetical protein
VILNGIIVAPILETFTFRSSAPSLIGSAASLCISAALCARVPDLLAARIRGPWAKHGAMRSAPRDRNAIVMVNGSLVPELFRTRMRYSGASLGKQVRRWR